MRASVPHEDRAEYPLPPAQMRSADLPRGPVTSGMIRRGFRCFAGVSTEPADASVGRSVLGTGKTRVHSCPSGRVSRTAPSVCDSGDRVSLDVQPPRSPSARRLSDYIDTGGARTIRHAQPRPNRSSEDNPGLCVELVDSNRASKYSVHHSRLLRGHTWARQGPLVYARPVPPAGAVIGPGSRPRQLSCSTPTPPYDNILCVATDDTVPSLPQRRFLDRTVVVIGGGQTPGATVGNGRAAAILYGREGANVLVCDRDPVSAEETAGLIRQEGGTASGHRVDVLVEDDLRQVMELCRAQHGRIDVLHYNVGVSQAAGDAPVTDITADAFSASWTSTFVGWRLRPSTPCRSCVPRGLESSSTSVRSPHG